jgi:hypothetical protein
VTSGSPSRNSCELPVPPEPVPLVPEVPTPPVPVDPPVPKFVALSDPAAQWTGALRNAAFFAYADNYLIDIKFGIIMDVEAPGRSANPRLAQARRKC